MKNKCQVLHCIANNVMVYLAIPKDYFTSVVVTEAEVPLSLPLTSKHQLRDDVNNFE